MLTVPNMKETRMYELSSPDCLKHSVLALIFQENPYMHNSSYND